MPRLADNAMELSKSSSYHRLRRLGSICLFVSFLFDALFPHFLIYNKRAKKNESSSLCSDFRGSAFKQGAFYSRLSFGQLEKECPSIQAGAGLRKEIDISDVYEEFN